MSYYLKKYDYSITYILGDIVYYFGRRYYCNIPDRCNDYKNYNPSDPYLTWIVIEYSEAVNLEKDDYYKVNLYKLNQEYIILGIKYKCISEAACNAKTNNPLAYYNSAGWEKVGTVEQDLSKCKKADQNTA